MKKKSLKICALPLVIAMALSGCGSEAVKEETTAKTETANSVQEEAVQETESAYPEYLNLDSGYPIVKDEYADDISEVRPFMVLLYFLSH